MVVLYVDDSKDDAFFFGRALKKVSPALEWRHVFDTQEAKCYLRGEGLFSSKGRGASSPDDSWPAKGKFWRKGGASDPNASKKQAPGDEAQNVGSTFKCAYTLEPFHDRGVGSV